MDIAGIVLIITAVVLFTIMLVWGIWKTYDREGLTWKESRELSKLEDIRRKQDEKELEAKNRQLLEIMRKTYGPKE